MKKIFSISILFLVACLLFTACGPGAGGGTGNADFTPLFSESEAPIVINSLALSDLSDGTWEFKFYRPFEYSTPESKTIYFSNGGGSVSCHVTSCTWVYTQVFTKSGSNITVTSGTDVDTYTMDNENKALVNAYASNHGLSLSWNGNTLTTTDTTYLFDTWINTMFERSAESYYTTKKNTAGTRYTVIDNFTNITKHTSYFLKKQ